MQWRSVWCRGNLLSCVSSREGAWRAIEIGRSIVSTSSLLKKTHYLASEASISDVQRWILCFAIGKINSSDLLKSLRKMNQVKGVLALGQLGIAVAHCKLEPKVGNFIKVLCGQEIYRYALMEMALDVPEPLRITVHLEIELKKEKMTGTSIHAHTGVDQQRQTIVMDHGPAASVPFVDGNEGGPSSNTQVGTEQINLEEMDEEFTLITANEHFHL